MDSNSMSKPQSVAGAKSLQASGNIAPGTLWDAEMPTQPGCGMIGKKMPELPAPIAHTRFNLPVDGVVVHKGVMNLPAYFNGNDAALN